MRFAFLLACVTLSAQTPPPPGRSVNFYSIEKEKALGAQLAAEYRKQTRMLDAPAVNAYLNELGQRVAAQALATGFTYTFELTDDDRTWIHEADVFPGGPIFVPTSLILAAADEDELAAMLAHAIAHISTRHEMRQAAPGQVVTYSAVPLIMMGGWSGFAARKQGDAMPVAFRSLQRKNELESDEVAVRMLSAAGYDPRALARYIERVQPADPPLRNDSMPYPGKDQRLAALQAAIEQLPPVTYSAHPRREAIFQEVTLWTVSPTKNPPRLAR